MKKVGDMKLYSFEELLEEDYGKIGTPELSWARKWGCRGLRYAV